MAFGEEGYNPFQAEHAQCNKCGKMLRGPHENTYFADTNVYAADKERVYTREEAEAAGLRHNVSGTLCPKCVQDVKAAWGASARHRAYVKRQREQAHELREQQQREQREAERRSYEANVAPVERARATYAERARQSVQKVEGTGQEETG